MAGRVSPRLGRGGERRGAAGGRAPAAAGRWLLTAILVCLLVGGRADFFNRTGGAVSALWGAGRSVTSLFSREPQRALETDEHGFFEHLEQVRSGETSPEYLVVLFYARWCPFSREMRKIVDDLQPVFPRDQLKVLAVEESNSTHMMFSRVGIHSFPAVYVHMKGTRRKFSGPRTLHHLAGFVANLTSLKPLREVPPGVEGGSEGGSMWLRDWWLGAPAPAQQVPPEAEKVDVYLVLGSVFLGARAAYELMRWFRQRGISGLLRWATACWKALRQGGGGRKEGGGARSPALEHLHEE